MSDKENENGAMPEILVCDAIMGSGKTESAITYINEHPGQKFIYITPYLSEAARIRDGCPSADFVEPSSRIPDVGFRKLKHIASLIKKGKNIASTHAAFVMYTPEMLRDVKEKDYTLIIDESLDILDEVVVNKCDIDLLIRGGLVRRTKTGYTTVGCIPYEPDGTDAPAVFEDFFRMLKYKGDSVISVSDKKNAMFFWQLPTDFVSSFKRVFLMTYMVEGQEIGCYFRANGFEYKKIGVTRDHDGTYRFGKYQEYIPEYVHTLKEKIHLLDHKKLNAIGEKKTDLSMGWMAKTKDNPALLKRALQNLYTHIWTDKDLRKNLMWGTYKEYEDKVAGRGWSKSYLVFNARAMNGYRDKTHLVYLANVYLNVGHKLLFKRLGAPIDEDAYALSTLIQWIWRSAIRDGNDIWLYLPSSRMRRLLLDWIDEVSKGGDLACANEKTACTGAPYASAPTMMTKSGRVNTLSLSA